MRTRFFPPVAFNDANGDEVDWPSLLDPYLKNVNIHRCPTDILSKTNSYGLNELGFVDLTDPGVTTSPCEPDGLPYANR